MSVEMNIRVLRKKEGLSQEQLAEKVGVSVMTVRRWEWGETAPNAKMLLKLAEVLNTTQEYLLSDNILTDIMENTLEPRKKKQPEEYQSITYWGNFLENVKKIAQRGNLTEISLVENFLQSASGLLSMGKLQTPHTVSAYNGNNSVYAGNNLNTGTIIK